MLLFILTLLLAQLARAADASLPAMEFDLVFPRNETYAPTQYFPLVLAVRNPIATWPLGLHLKMVIWPDSDELPPFNSTFEFPAREDATSGLPSSAPNFFFIAGTPYTNGTVGGFTVLWSMFLKYTCREPGVVNNWGEFNVRFSTALGAPLPDIEAAVNDCLKPTSTLVLAQNGFFDGECPLLSTNVTNASNISTPAAADLCGLKPVAKELAANVSTAMLGLMECSEGTWQNITQHCTPKPTAKSGGSRWTPGPEMGWMLLLAAAYAFL